MRKVKVVVFVPESHAEIVRSAIAEAGGGVIGKYSHCSFSTKGIGRFKPIKGARPAIGKIGKQEAVEEERIEFVCPKRLIKKVFEAIKKVHPYDEVALDVYLLIGIS